MIRYTLLKYPNFNQILINSVLPIATKKYSKKYSLTSEELVPCKGIVGESLPLDTIVGVESALFAVSDGCGGFRLGMFGDGAAHAAPTALAPCRALKNNKLDEST